MNIKQLKKELGLRNKDLAEFCLVAKKKIKHNVPQIRLVA